MAQLEAVTSENDERLPRLATASFVALLAAPDKTALHVATVSVFLRVNTGNRKKKVLLCRLPPTTRTPAAIAPISAALSARARSGREDTCPAGGVRPMRPHLRVEPTADALAVPLV